MKNTEYLYVKENGNIRKVAIERETHKFFIVNGQKVAKDRMNAGDVWNRTYYLLPTEDLDNEFSKQEYIMQIEKKFNKLAKKATIETKEKVILFLESL